MMPHSVLVCFGDITFSSLHFHKRDKKLSLPALLSLIMSYIWGTKTLYFGNTVCLKLSAYSFCQQAQTEVQIFDEKLSGPFTSDSKTFDDVVTHEVLVCVSTDRQLAPLSVYMNGT